MRALIGVLIVLLAGSSWAGTERLKLGENSIFSDTHTKERLQPSAEVCLQGESCAGSKPGSATIVADNSGPKTAEEIYQNNCMGCHATGAAGAPKVGDKSAWENRMAIGIDALVKSATKGMGAMPPKGMCGACSESDLKGVVEYMLKKSGVSSSASGSAVTQQASAPVINGEEIYSQRCSVCHGQGIAGAPKVGDHSAWVPRIAKGLDVLTANAINGINAMPPKGTCNDCSDDQIKAAIQYMVDNSQ